MKKLLFLLLGFLIVSVSSPAQAGDCSTRSSVNWHATVSSATHVRVDCDDHKGPVGDSVGVVPAGEVIRILEVDRNQEYFIVQTSKGKGFIYKTFLKDIVQSPLPGTEQFVNSIFTDLPTDHQYYSQIADVKSRGIVGGSNGMIKADDPINRVELAKILVEATAEDSVISKASLSDSTYSDIELKAWYLPYLKVAKDRGIMTGDKSSSGFGPTTVRPGDSANGGEVAKMIAVAFDLQVRASKDGERWYKPYLEALRELNALPYTKGDHQVTRAEMMFMVSMVLSKKS